MLNDYEKFIAWLLAAMVVGVFVVVIIKTTQDKPMGETLGAPASNVLRNIMPEANDTYEIVSSTISRFWKNIFVNQASTSAVSITRTLFVGGTASTTGTATTTIVGANATSTFSGGIRLAGGCFELSTGTCLAGGGGITSLNGLTGATQTFTDDTNVTIASAGTAHALGWSGTLALSRGGTAASLSGASRIIHMNTGNTALTN